MNATSHQSLRRGAVCNPRFGPGRPRRSLHDLHSLAGEDIVEHAGELGVTVPDEEAEGADPVCEVHEQVAGLPRASVSTMVAPCVVAISRAMANPRPTDPLACSRLASSWTIRPNTRSRSPAGMPGPSSAISTT